MFNLDRFVYHYLTSMSWQQIFIYLMIIFAGITALSGGKKKVKR